MNLAVCSSCGVMVDFDMCCQVYGAKEDYYGMFTKCPVCSMSLYQEEVSKYLDLFDNAEGEEVECFR